MRGNDHGILITFLLLFLEIEYVFQYIYTHPHTHTHTLKPTRACTPNNTCCTWWAIFKGKVRLDTDLKPSYHMKYDITEE